MNSYDSTRKPFAVIEFTPPPFRPDPTPEPGEHIVYESTLDAQYRASAATVPRLRVVTP